MPPWWHCETAWLQNRDQWALGKQEEGVVHALATAWAWDKVTQLHDCNKHSKEAGEKKTSCYPIPVDGMKEALS